MDGNRTRLGLIDSEVPYPESYHGMFGIAYGIQTRVHKLKAYVSCPVDERDIIKQDTFLFTN